MRADENALESERERKAKYAADQRKAEEDEKKRAHLDSLSPFERTIETILGARPKDQSEVKALFNALKNKHWQGEEAREVAQRIQAQMRANGQWREKSEKKNPQKDEPYQMTMFVKSVLSP